MSRGLWVWGVDVATTRYDFAFVNLEGGWSYNAVEHPAPQHRRPRGARRSKDMLDHTRQFAKAMAKHFPPLIVYVERPVGRHPSPPLTMAAGIAQVAIYEALFTTYAYPVDVVLTSTSEWKKGVLGNGSAGKAAVMEWARGVGYGGERQDPADALAIAAFAAMETGHGPGPLHALAAAVA